MLKNIKKQRLELPTHFDISMVLEISMFRILKFNCTHHLIYKVFTEIIIWKNHKSYHKIEDIKTLHYLTILNLKLYYFYTTRLCKRNFEHI